MLRGPAIDVTFTLPFTRHTTSLMAAEHHQILLGDCAQHRLQDDDDRPTEESTCANAKLILVLDFVWNLAFVLVAAGVLLFTLNERPSTPLRVWLCGYAFDCILHMIFVYFVYWRRTNDNYGAEFGLLLSESRNSIVKKLECMNALASSVWWVIGFYWIVVGDPAPLQDCPHLFWLTVVFLGFGVLIVILCIGIVCAMVFAVLCFIPIIAFACAIRIREGASEEDIKILPKYVFSHSNSLVMVDDNMEELVKARKDACNGNNVRELSLHEDDSECCICLSPYVAGAELYRLPCKHHFHCICISRWLRTKATCPLCKFNIVKGDSLV